MKSILRLSFAAAIALLSLSANAQNFHYAGVQKTFQYNSGFGINHAHVAKKSGVINVDAGHITIDGTSYTLVKDSEYMSEDGKDVHIVYGYQGKELGAITVAKNDVVTEYLLKDAAADIAAAKAQRAASESPVASK